MVSLFDILGPVMVGPSSSHTAGACRLGLMARAILGDAPEQARIPCTAPSPRRARATARTARCVGGLAGLAPDDLRLRDAFTHAEAAGIEWSFESVDLGEAHPNTAVFEVSRGTESVRVQGASVGGGRIEVTEIDGFAVSLGGDHHTLVVLARDEPGTIATIAGAFARDDLNLATMRVDRTGRHKDALMTIEVDDAIPDAVLDELRSKPWLRWARRVERAA